MSVSAIVEAAMQDCRELTAAGFSVRTALTLNVLGVTTTAAITDETAGELRRAKAPALCCNEVERWRAANAPQG